MADRFPHYDVLAKRDGPSWNARTREVVDARLALTDEGEALTARQRLTLRVVADRIVPQPEGRPPVDTAAILVEKIATDTGDGFRPEGLPRVAEAWRRGLDALEAEAMARHARSLDTLAAPAIDALLRAIEKGEVKADWHGLDPALFWKWRFIPDLVSAYYAHPSAWSAMGFGGPASPRGYVRLQANRRDAWEAAEQADGRAIPARVRNDHVG